MPRLTAEQRAEFERVMAVIDATVAAGARAGRWGALESAMEQYGHALGIAPVRLFHAALLRRLAQHTRAETDPVRFAELVTHYETGLEMLDSDLTLHQVIDLVAAVAAFNAIQRGDGYTRN